MTGLTYKNIFNTNLWILSHAFLFLSSYAVENNTNIPSGKLVWHHQLVQVVNALAVGVNEMCECTSMHLKTHFCYNA